MNIPGTIGYQHYFWWSCFLKMHGQNFRILARYVQNLNKRYIAVNIILLKETFAKLLPNCFGYFLDLLFLGLRMDEQNVAFIYYDVVFQVFNDH